MAAKKRTTVFAAKFAIAMLALCLLLISPQSQFQAKAQDILRHRQQQNVNNVNNPLANIQLPPQLASLTPQQLHQLAQLRELQIQQQAAQQQRDASSQTGAAPAPIGIDAATTPTAQPAGSNGGAQIPQPTSAAAAASSDTNDRHDDGAYNESGSEMEGVSQSDGNTAQPLGAKTAAPGDSAAATAAATPTFEVNWNKCPQLEPSESEKSKKTQVITKCLQSAPIPSNLTRENVETHREQIATCALKVEGWFDEQGNYRYDKAEAEIRGKKLESAIELQVLKFHVACKDEASKKFPRDQNKLIDQVQFYQACMDYYISIVCEIEVSVEQ